jgi:hypothetical protein
MTRQDFLAEILWKCSAAIPGDRGSVLQAIDLTRKWPGWSELSQGNLPLRLCSFSRWGRG